MHALLSNPRRASSLSGNTAVSCSCRLLYLHMNSLTGSIPASLGNLSSLVYVALTATASPILTCCYEKDPLSLSVQGFRLVFELADGFHPSITGFVDSAVVSVAARAAALTFRCPHGPDFTL